MPQDMTITKVISSREWDGPHGKMIFYKIELEGHGEADLGQKDTTPPPKVGDSIFGDLEDGKFGKKVKKAQKGGFGGGGRSPAETKAIQRQHSQEMALRYVAAKGKTDFSFDDVKKLTDAFEKDIAG